MGPSSILVVSDFGLKMLVLGVRARVPLRIAMVIGAIN